MTECDQQRPDPPGLYDPRSEHDSCGFGLIAQLDDRDYATRERATKELRELGFAAFPALKKALADNPPEELRARAERLLAATTSPDVRRAERAVEAMQLAGTESARKVIAEWAKGPADETLTKAAKGR